MMSSAESNCGRNVVGNVVSVKRNRQVQSLVGLPVSQGHRRRRWCDVLQTLSLVSLEKAVFRTVPSLFSEMSSVSRLTRESSEPSGMSVTKLPPMYR